MNRPRCDGGVGHLAPHPAEAEWRRLKSRGGAPLTYILGDGLEYPLQALAYIINVPPKLRSLLQFNEGGWMCSVGSYPIVLNCPSIAVVRAKLDGKSVVSFKGNLKLARVMNLGNGELVLYLVRCGLEYLLEDLP